MHLNFFLAICVFQLNEILFLQYNVFFIIEDKKKLKKMSKNLVSFSWTQSRVSVSWDKCLITPLLIWSIP